MDELVMRLSTAKHPVETVRPEKTAGALKECIDRDYVHIMFTETGTELGVQLDRSNCDLNGDFQNGVGKIHIEGGLTLNYEKVRVVADIDLSTLEGEGNLVPVSDSEYNLMMGK
ncbi:hypothetical protein D3C81_1775510 [compost metagenome]